MAPLVRAFALMTFVPHAMDCNALAIRAGVGLQAGGGGPSARDQALFTRVPVDEDVEPVIKTATRCSSVALVQYHKTGHDFTRDVANLFNSVIGWDVVYLGNESSLRTPWGRIDKTFFNDDWANSAKTIARLSFPSTDWNIPDDACVVNFFRDPQSLILSSYRYHVDRDDMEPWEALNRTCHSCDEESLREIFSRCPNSKDRCSYSEVLTTTDTEEDALQLDATMERNMLRTMMGNFERWMNHPRVLHLTMNHLYQDSDASIGCMLGFLGLNHADRLHHELAEMAKTPSHPTHGLFDNAHLQEFLKAHPAWGQQLQKAQGAPSKVFERQHAQYGCPVPDL